MITSIVSAVAIFAILIVVHEAGHFFMAKRMGVRVLRFSVGYPPRLFGIRRGQTDYAIGATPLGGYVRMLGDEVAEEPTAETLEGYVRELQADVLEAMRCNGKSEPRCADADGALLDFVHRLAPPEGGQPRPAETAESILGRPLTRDEAILFKAVERRNSVEEAVKELTDRRPAELLRCYCEQAFPTQTLSTRIKIVLAGPLANILFAPLLMAVIFLYGVPYMKPVLGNIKAGMPAQKAGLKTGDRILSVDKHKITTWVDLSDAVKSSGGARLKVGIARPEPNGATKNLSLFVTPVKKQEKTIYGNMAPVWLIGVMPSGDEGVQHFGVFKALGKSVIATVGLTGRMMTGIAMIINGTTPARQALGGPIMIAKIAGKEARQGFADLVGFMVMLSLELGIINLLPIPLLDGGHLFFFIIEGLRGKPLQLRHREFAMQIGLLLLVALMTFVIINDISHIMHG